MNGLTAFKSFTWALCASLCVAAGSARASVLFDTITGVAQSGYNTLQVGSGGSPLGNSFTVNTSGQIGRISLSLGAFNPTDNGSVLVYIVPDVSGLPSHVGSSTTLSNRTLLGTIRDTSLTLAGQSNAALPTTSIQVNYQFSPGTFWIELVDSLDIANGGNGTASSAVWAYNADDAGFGTTNQFFSFNNGSSLVAVSDTSGPFRLTIDATVGDVAVQEPASVLVLGAALIGCCALTGRRRWRAS